MVDMAMSHCTEVMFVTLTSAAAIELPYKGLEITSNPYFRRLDQII